jgi:hypothetical protein
MKTIQSESTCLRRLWALAAIMTLINQVSAQSLVTNWAAFNDHNLHLGPAPTTGPNVTLYHLGIGPGGPLIDQASGEEVPVMLVVTGVGGDGPDNFGASMDADPGTPADLLFNGIVDIGGVGVGIDEGIIGVRNSETNMVTLTFTNLNPSRKYLFRGTSVRGNNYNDRWAVYTIQGASGFVDAHVNGSSNTNIFTMATFPSGALTNGQVAINSGENRTGSLAGWNEIDPGPDGGFSILQEQYFAGASQTPFGDPSAGPYGYGMNAIYLVELAPPAPVSIVQQPPAAVTVEEFRLVTLSARADGVPLPRYQWYKDGTAIEGATRRIYTITNAAIEDSGDYFVIAENLLNSATSSSATLTVLPDTNAPVVVRAAGSATFDRITVEFNEVLDAASIGDPFNFMVSSVGGPLQVDAVALSPDGKSILLTTGPQTPDTEYSVTVSAVTDLAGNGIGTGTGSFRSWVNSGACAGAIFEAFNGTPGPATAGVIAGNTVNLLTSHPSYPDNPSERLLLTRFDSREAYPDDTHEGYGGRIRGVFIPPYSGDWVLYLRCDDGAQLFFNPNGPDASGKVLVREFSGVNANFASGASTPFMLTAGQAYYMEALYKEGVGGDYLQVAAKVTSDTNAPNSLAPIPGAWLGFPAAPPGIAPDFGVTQQPVNQSVTENSIVTFTVGVNNPRGLPVCYQWTRDGADIPGANNSSYTFGPVPLADNGARFQVRVGIIGASATSSEATLDVRPDDVPPTVVGVQSSALSLSNVVVQFSELMVEGDVEDLFNYSLPGFMIVGATLEADGRSVTVQLENPLVLNTTYQIEVLGGSDLAGNPLSPSPTNITFVAGGELPRLAISQSGNQVVISWPAPSTGFVLEQADGIVTPVSSINWTLVGTAPTVINGRNTVSVTVGSGTRIFRLRQ